MSDGGQTQKQAAENTNKVHRGSKLCCWSHDRDGEVSRVQFEKVNSERSLVLGGGDETVKTFIVY